jgi:hypothetical protein
MPLRVLPDVEAIVRAYLVSNSSVNALTPRISTELPPPPVQFPLVTYWRFGGSSDWPGEIDQVSIQLEAWGRTRPEANNLGLTVRAAMYQIPGVYAQGVILHAFESSPYHWQPDPTFTPAQPRFLTGFTLTARPN